MKPLTTRTRLNGTRLAAATGSLALAAALTGCGLGGNFAATTTGSSSVAANVLSGSVHGGQQAVSGATIQLYAAGIPATGSGYGVGATPLLTSTVTTDANGAFSITGRYTCPTPAQQVYIVATGGNPGLAAGTNNTGLAEMAALGTCPAGGTLLTSTPFIQITEVTTVSAVTALQQFMAAPASANKFGPNVGAPTTTYATGTTVGSVASAVTGMNNAFITAKVLADPATGISPNLNYAYATPETAKINTIADILSYCINSTGTSTDGNCAALFSAVTPTGKTAAADTIQAAYYMAQNPINNLTALYNLIPASPPYQPIYLAPQTLNSTSTGPATNAFNDTTIAINYAPTAPSSTNSAVSAPYAVAIDAFGNAWVSNAGGVGGTTASIAELGVDGSSLGTPSTGFTVSTTSGASTQFTATPTATARTFNAPKGIAIDLFNRAWIANELDVPVVTTANGAAINAGTVGVFTGSTASGSAGAGGGTGSTGYYTGYTPWGMTADGAGNVYVVNTGTLTTASNLDGRSVAKFTSSAGSASDGTYTYSTSSSTTAPNNTPGGQALLAVDNNTNVNGGIVWALNYNACKVQGQYNAITPFGTINLYDTSLNSLSLSEIVSAYSNQVAGAPSSSICATASVGVGQTITAATANPYGVAIDRNNGAWLSDVFTSSLGFDGLTYVTAPSASTGSVPSSYFLVNGTLPTTSAGGVAGTTLTKAGMDAVDGNNNVWIANQTAKSIVEASFSAGTITLLTPGQGSAYGSAGAPNGIGFVHSTSTGIGIAIDSSGNVWVANNSTSSSSTYTNQTGTATPTGNSVTVIVGAAGPVVTPLALAVKSTKLGTKP